MTSVWPEKAHFSELRKSRATTERGKSTESDILNYSTNLILQPNFVANSEPGPNNKTTESLII